jgi:hypothetical protein
MLRELRMSEGPGAVRGQTISNFMQSMNRCFTYLDRALRLLFECHMIIKHRASKVYRFLSSVKCDESRLLGAGYVGNCFTVQTSILSNDILMTLNI